MGLRWSELLIDCTDVTLVATFWAAALGVPLPPADEDGEYEFFAGEGGPKLLFLRDPNPKVVKNRLHLDLTPTGGAAEQTAEVERVIALGARRIDIGQRPDSTWVVLADPEGNEFCVLRGQ